MDWEWESSSLRKYLLGNISEKARSDFDLQLLSNREFATAIEIAEEELIDDYLDEILSANELEKFEQLFLNSPQRIKQIEGSRQLKNLVRQSISATVQQKDARASDFVSKLRSRFFLRPIFVVPSLALFLILLVLSYFVLENRITRNRALEENEIAEMNQRDLTNLSEYDALTKLTLVSDATRDSRELRSLSSRNMSDLILIRLALPPSITSERVRIGIKTNNVSVVNLENIRVYVNQAGRDVRLIVPRVKLAVARYVLEITEDHSNARATYLFDVEP